MERKFVDLALLTILVFLVMALSGSGRLYVEAPRDLYIPSYLPDIMILVFFASFFMFLLANRHILIGIIRELIEERPFGAGGRSKKSLLGTIFLVVTIIALLLYGRPGVDRRFTHIDEQRPPTYNQSDQGGGRTVAAEVKWSKEPQDTGVRDAARAGISLVIFATILLMVFIFLKALVPTTNHGASSSLDSIGRGMTAAIEESMARIRYGDDIRASIVATYRKLCSILREHGSQIEPFQTPREFEKVVLSKFRDMPARHLHRLTLLFEESIYSMHQFTEKDRNDALDCLENIKSYLEGRINVRD